MTETTTAPQRSSDSSPGLLARLIGVIFSPRDTYAAVSSRPRALGALLAVGLVVVACQSVFMSTEVGREMVIDAQVTTMESFGMTVTDEMVTQIEAGADRSRFINPVITLIFIPIVN